MTERWAQVVGRSNYEVSDAGRLRRADTKRVLKPQLNKGDGYYRFEFWRGGYIKMHQEVLKTFVGPRPNNADARHLNDDKTDNRLENLTWGSRSQNLHDAVRNGKHHSTTIFTCAQGHPYDGHDGRGRTCSRCMRVKWAKYARKKREGGKFEVMPNPGDQFTREGRTLVLVQRVDPMGDVPPYWRVKNVETGRESTIRENLLAVKYMRVD